jgi:serine protease inhibitor
MRQDAARVPYYENADYQSVSLPYVGNADMLIILPRAEQFADVEQQLNADFIENVRSEAREHMVDLTLPRFNIETNMNVIRHRTHICSS